MSFRILHLSDLHLDRAFASMACQNEMAKRRRYGLRQALVRAGELAQELDCQLVTLGGDIYEHERADLETGRFLVQTLGSWPMQVAIAPGNHDPLLPDSLYCRNQWPKNVHLFAENRFTPLDLLPGLRLWGLGHPDPNWQEDPLGNVPELSNSDLHVGLFHGAELGHRPQGKSTHGPFYAQQIKECGFILALCGHYHRRRIDETNQLLYPGSPEPLTFDESGERGPVIIDIASDGALQYRPLAANNWWAKTITCDVAQCTSFTDLDQTIEQNVRSVLSGQNPERWLLRVDLVGELSSSLPVDISLLEKLIQETTELAVVQIRDLSSAHLDIHALAQDPTARGMFVRTLQTKLIEAEGDTEKQQLLEDAMRYGLQALNGVDIGLR